MSDRFGGARVRQGLLHFLLGKGVSALSGFLAMLLVVRVLSVPAFAQYSVLAALTEVFTALAGLGIAHAMLRYVPELYARNLSLSLWRLVLGGVGLRTAVLILIALSAALWVQDLAPLVGLAADGRAFTAFLFVVLFRSTSHFLSQILESALSQGWSQSAFALSSVVRLLGMAWLAWRGGVDLVEVIALEALADLGCMAVMCFAIVRLIGGLRPPFATADEDRTWMARRLPDIARFSTTGYLQHLAALPFGSNTNRMIGGRLFTPFVMASFGYATSLYEYVKRYLPAQLLVGLIRPVVVARYSLDANFARAAQTADRVTQCNLVMLVALGCPMLVAGPELMLLGSGGRYGAEAASLLLSLLLVLSLESFRVTLEMLVHTIERYSLLIRSNLLLAASALLGVALYPHLGAAGLPLASALSLLTANAWVMRNLRADGFQIGVNWRAVLQIGLGCFASAAAGWLMRQAGAHWVLATALATASGVSLAIVARRRDLRALKQELLSGADA